MDTLGRRVKELRLKKGLTQVELGNLSGIHHTNIGRIENKDAVPQADVLYLIAKNLDTSVEWLLTGRPESQTLGELSVLESQIYHTLKHESVFLKLYQIYIQLPDSDKKEILRYAKFMLYHSKDDT